MGAPREELEAAVQEERRHRARRAWTLVVALGLVAAQLFTLDVIGLLNTMAQGWDADSDMRAWTRLHVVSAALLLITVVGLFVGRKRGMLLWTPLVLGTLAAALLVGSIVPLAQARAAARNIASIGPSPVMLVEALANGGWRDLVGAGVTWAAAVALAALALVYAPRGARGWRGPRRSLRRRLRDSVRQGGFFRALIMNPAAVFFGPIFYKEVRVLGRKRGTYLARLLYPLGLLGIVWLVYGASVSEVQHGSGAQRLQRLQEIAPALATAIAWFQFVLLLLIAPTLTGPAICEERRTRTLSALMTTPMTSAQIVFGNFASRLVQVLILALVSAPFLMAIRLFGGLEAEVILAIESITISSVLFISALGLLFSIWSRKPVVASAGAVLVFLLATLVPIFVVVLVAFRRGGPPFWLMPLSAPVALGLVVESIMGGTPPGMSFRQMWAVNTGVNLAGTVAVCLLASAAMRRVMLSDAVEMKRPVVRRKRSRKRRGAPDLSAAAQTDEPNQHEPAAPEDPHEVYEERETVVGDRPVLWRELRAPVLGSTRNRAVVLTVAGLALAWLYYEMPPWEDQAHYVVCIVTMLTLCLAAALSTTGAVAGEKEASTWMVLLTTPLSPMEILLGKAAGALRRHWIAAMVLGIDLVVAVVLRTMRPVLIVHIALIATGVALFLAGTGLLFSMVFRKGTNAAALNVGLGVLLWLGVPVMGSILSDFFGLGRHNEVFADTIMGMNPIYLTVAALEGGQSGRLHEYRFDSGTVSTSEFTLIVASVAALYALVGAGCMVFAARLFPRLSGRTS